jgi:hypothetical protein
MSCERYRKTLVEIAAGAPSNAEVEAHLASCVACRSELGARREALGLADAVLGAIASEEPSPALRARIHAAAADDEAAAPMAWSWLWPAVAAALVIVAAAAGVWHDTGSVPGRQTLATPLQPSQPVGAPDEPARGVHDAGSPSPGEAPRTPVVATRVAGARPPGRHLPRSEPEVLVPPGQEEALVRLVAFMQRERAVPRALLTAGEPPSDLPEPAAIAIKPIEIVPLDPAETPGT